ncbi:MAG TPA: deoxynucleoside kinase [Acidimicrobiia bacterium]|jgi:deoxyadenosine/deoxycytidine kinase/nucleoside 2-deoxyribosyltransferase
MTGLRRPRAYYAAGLFNQAERTFNLQVKAMLDDLGYETWFPQEDAGFLEQYMEQGMTLDEARNHIYATNVAAVEASDVLIICLDGRVPDEGACIEAGVAFGRGKRCVGLQTDFRAVEPGGNNLMIDGILDGRIARSIEELRGMLEQSPVGVDLTADLPAIDLRTGGDCYVAVSGPLGSGKSTLIDLLAAQGGWSVLAEPVNENPYLLDVYSNLSDLGFRMQAYYLGQRARQHLASRDLRGAVVQERSLLEDGEVFFPVYRDQGAYGDHDLDTLVTLYESLVDTVPQPDVIVYLEASFDATLARIAARDRAAERTVDPAFLRAVYDAYEKWAAVQLDPPVVRIDTERLDFVNDPAAAAEVMRLIDRGVGAGTLVT